MLDIMQLIVNNECANDEKNGNRKLQNDQKTSQFAAFKAN